MARGYWQPPNSENLIACEGYYIPFNLNRLHLTSI